MATPLLRGKPYMALVTLPNSPVENETMIINVGSKYSFTEGNSVIIAGRYNTGFHFEAIVGSYVADTGVMTLDEITNIVGTYTQLCTVTLAGQRGSKIIGGNGAPNDTSGRPGDLYIDKITGEIYLKS